MIYQIAYDRVTQDNCIYPVIMNSKITPYFENKVIVDFVEKHGCGDFYFGILSHKFFDKNFRVTSQKIDDAISKEYDCISFFNKMKDQDLLKCAEMWHAGFIDLFNDIVTEAGLPTHTGKRWNLIVYQNAFISKSEIYEDYVKNWLQKVIEVMESGKFDTRLWVDSGYYRKNEPAIREKLIRDLGVDYYPLHTFILERLPSLYFQHHKLNYISL